jgi:pimeloyl-ACP methyl ester carboxylesterase
MPLHADHRGRGPRLVLVHGFTQTRRCWGTEADGLAVDHELVLVDAPGHGRSTDVAAGLLDGAALLADVGGDATYLGYSMGARFALHVALARPEVVRGLVLLSGTAGIEDDDERAARREQDRRTATRLLDQIMVRNDQGGRRRQFCAPHARTEAGNTWSIRRGHPVSN